MTMVLGGLWHGAAWTFVFWGIFHGLWLALHRLIRGETTDAPKHSWLAHAWRRAGTFHAVCFGWLLFRAESMQVVAGMLHAMVQKPRLFPEFTSWLFQLAVLGLPLLAVQILQERTNDSLAPLRLSIVPRTALYMLLILLFLLLANTGSRAFIYFQF